MVDCIAIERRANGKDKNAPVKNRKLSEDEDD